MDKEMPRWILVALAIAFAALGLMLLDAREDLHMYTTYFREKSPDVSLRIGELSSQMDEAALRQHFEGVPLNCVAETSTLGDRLCYSNIDSADRRAALALLAFLNKGRLAHVVVHVPWWKHGAWLRSLKLKYGASQNAGVVGDERGAVLRWNMDNGYLEMNQSRAFNPLTLSTLFWTASPKQ
ncbi:hypothetical protein [Rhodoferax sp.]|uniref:hypothetical protein n=1 Tax=Rhodoferax sp. TaxID=50421 RepID=UPI002ACD700F|nr:hypothetical protein [Rhodoferax sp.]MDZ7919679.1 hypothetical protein [Rhodoferax sp.]